MAFLKAIDEGLAVLGESSRKIIYFHMKHKFSLKIEDIPGQPELFVLALKSLLGPSSSYIESLIIQKLSIKYCLDAEAFKGKPFQEAVEEIRHKMHH